MYQIHKKVLCILPYVSILYVFTGGSAAKKPLKTGAERWVYIDVGGVFVFMRAFRMYGVSS